MFSGAILTFLRPEGPCGAWNDSEMGDLVKPSNELYYYLKQI